MGQKLEELLREKGAQVQLDEEDRRVIDTSKRAYKSEIRKTLGAGYIGVTILERNGSNLLVFYRNLAAK